MGLNYMIPSLVLLTAIGGGILGYFILRDGELPEIPVEHWGPPLTLNAKQDTSIRPFQINISEKVLADLKTRLSLEVATLDDRIVDTLQGIGFEYGMNKKFLKKVTTYWLNKYDWKQREKLLNKYPSFKTNIQGIDIHFQHIKSSKKHNGGSSKPIPILLMHGWPGSFVEYQQLISLLVEPKNSDINFEVVIPNLPGFGFSDSATKPGLGTAEMSPIMLNLMKRLGYEKFYVQGSDFGSVIASNMATLYKDNVLGAHLTMCYSMHPRSILKFGAALVLPQLFMDNNEMAQHFPISRLITKVARESGYLHIQAGKPDTQGVGLSQSPSALLAHIIEKFSFFTNQNWLNKEDGGISSHYNLDQLLDNVMVHWVGKSTTTFMRVYKESFTLSTYQIVLERVPTQVPVSCLNLPEELFSFPKFPLVEKYQNLVRYTHAKTGGHFNALEVPELVANDIIQSINQMEKDRAKPKAEL